MDVAIITAIIGAIGVIIAAAIPHIIKFIKSFINRKMIENQRKDSTKEETSQKVCINLDDANKQAIFESKLLNYFRPNNKLDKQRRTVLTEERVAKMEGEICLLAVAGTSYLPLRSDATSFSIQFIKKISERKIQLRLILLNPYSSAAKFRFSREIGDDVDAIADKKNNIQNYEQSEFYTDFSNTIKKVKELKEAGADIECKLTNFEPAISTMFSERLDFTYIDILSLGRIDDLNEKIPLKQRSTFPILEFSSNSEYFKIAKSHFEYHWKYGITLDEFDNYEDEFKKRFYEYSITGYRLIKQHESWISIDPVIGCSNNCSYCVLQTTYNNNIEPKRYFNYSVISKRLRESKFYNENSTISLFNYTDALLPANRDELLNCLRDLKNNNFQNTISIATKVPFDESFLKNISNAYHRNKLIFFISFSGLPNKLEPSYHSCPNYD